jgi:hypothetical protein
MIAISRATPRRDPRDLMTLRFDLFKTLISPPDHDQTGSAARTSEMGVGSTGAKLSEIFQLRSRRSLRSR